MKARLLLIALLLCLLASTVEATSYAGGRARVSRTKADMRSMATAIESYRIDNPAYPPSTASPEWRFANSALTAPIAYLSFDPVDTFRASYLIPDHHPVLRRVGWSAVAFVGLFSTVALFLWMSTLARPSKGLLIFFARAGIYTAPFFFFAVLIISDMGWGPPGYRSIPNPRFVDQTHAFNYWTNGTDRWILQGVGPDGDRDLDDLSQFNDIDIARFAYDATNGIYTGGDVFRSNRGFEWWVE